MQRVFPGDVRAFANSRESQGKLAALTEVLARIHTGVFWLSLAGCLTICAVGSAGNPRVCPQAGPTRAATKETRATGKETRATSKGACRVNEFFYAAMVFLAINAAVCATLAGVFDRYQSRVAWLVPLCFMMYVCGLMREKKSTSA